MIRLALVTWAEAEAVGPAALSPAEHARWADFPSERRQRDFLAGRVAAKRALGAFLPGRLDAWTPGRLSSVTVVSGDGRPPRVAIAGVVVSIAHSGGVAFAAAGPEEPAFGVDIHLRRPVDDALRRLADGDDPNVIWAAKEAVLKAEGLGLGRAPESVVITRIGEHRYAADGAVVFYRDWGDFVLAVAQLGGAAEDPFMTATLPAPVGAPPAPR